MPLRCYNGFEFCLLIFVSIGAPNFGVTKISQSKFGLTPLGFVFLNDNF